MSPEWTWIKCRKLWGNQGLQGVRLELRQMFKDLLEFITADLGAITVGLERSSYIQTAMTQCLKFVKFVPSK